MGRITIILGVTFGGNLWWYIRSGIYGTYTYPGLTNGDWATVQNLDDFFFDIFGGNFDYISGMRQARTLVARSPP